MKEVILIITMTLLLACQAKSKSEFAEVITANETSAESITTTEPVQTVISFLKWYKVNYKDLNGEDLVDYKEYGGDTTKYYSVNFDKADKYLEKLKSSKLLTVGYLEAMKLHFLECDKNFQEFLQNEGPPAGFDYDQVLLTQEIDDTISALDKPTVINVSETSGKAVVNVDIYMNRSFKLSKIDGKWLIDKIELYAH
jgi:hypothetical protein